ncbi:MAG: hypothetical protein OXH75_08765 [Acidobacteria bacterium]|nr:hypothetical protein [Acidobacteriota bacterium]
MNGSVVIESRSRVAAGVVLAVALVVAMAAPPAASGGQDAAAASPYWSPTLRADGQPDITGMWNNSDAIFTPLEMPEELAGRDDIPAAELAERARARAEGRIEAFEWRGHENSRGVGGYGIHWFDWFWDDPVASDAPALIVEPATGRVPERTARARELIALNLAQLHDTYANMESGDRCISRGVLGMMMPTEYNNGTLILQPPGYVVIHSEMIHNARIIPIEGSPHLDSAILQWEGDPRGRWEGNTLVIESTNFRAVRNMRGATAGTRSRQTEGQRIVERITIDGPDLLRYSVRVDDPDTYTAPWTAAFPIKRDDGYVQFEYACHEGNYSVPNALGGARREEAEGR